MGAKDALRKTLKANGGTMDRGALEAAVTSQLISEGVKEKQAAKQVKKKLDSSLFLLTGNMVSLSKDKKRKAEDAEGADEGDAEVAAPPAKKKKKDKKDKAAASEPPVRASPRLQAQAASKTVPEMGLNAEKPKKVRPQETASASGALGTVKMMDPSRAAAFRKENRIEVSGDDSAGLLPVDSFADAGFSAAVLRACAKFSKPTPIQAQCWPIMMTGRDIIGVAETGSGKTLSFFLPAMMHCAAQPRASKSPSGGKPGPTVLVLAPTRELAMQSEAVCKSAGAEDGLSSICVYGGVPKGPQRQAIQQGVDVVVATPGRLLDLHEEGAVGLSSTTYLVLDEADRMLDMGFEKDVRSIISLTSPQRRTAMFTATWPDTVRALASEFLTRPVRVNVGSEDLSANKRVSQTVEVIDGDRKSSRLPQLLQKYHSSRTNRVLIFALYKKEAARVEQEVQRAGYSAIAIHGDLSQAQRTAALQQFKEGTTPLLIATDVAARGLDIPDVEVVINYSFPLTIEDYIHRIGRTGRAGKSGISHTLFTNFDKAHAGALQNVLREAGQEVPESLLRFGSAVKKKEHKMYGAFSGGGAEMKQATKITF
jgi:ATP-dependent RNA helicase DBP3